MFQYSKQPCLLLFTCMNRIEQDRTKHTQPRNWAFAQLGVGLSDITPRNSSRFICFSVQRCLQWPAGVRIGWNMTESKNFQKSQR